MSAYKRNTVLFSVESEKARTSTQFIENDKRISGRSSEYVRGLLEFDHETIPGPRWNQPLLFEKPSAGSKDLRGTVPSQVVGSYGSSANRQPSSK
jgi:hypothetical protein